MSTAEKPAVTFSETMKGPFTLNETDPESGASSGRSRGHVLAMHATVTVRDIDRFIADPDHRGSLVGSIDFTPWGTGIPAGEGTFNLFAPADDPQTKFMIYELPFRHEGEDYYLAGRKHVHDDPGPDLWKDTTTLFTQLHRGTDATGTVVGAGVLSLNAADFARILANLRVVGADSISAKAATLAKFGSFFAGQLWQTYVIPR